MKDECGSKFLDRTQPDPSNIYSSESDPKPHWEGVRQHLRPLFWGPEISGSGKFWCAVYNWNL